MNAIRAVTFLFIVYGASLCMATPQVPNTFVVKSNGAWVLWSDYLGGWSIIVHNEDANTKKVFRVEELLPRREFKTYVTTAGPFWGKCALGYVARLDGRDVFRVRTRHKTDLLIDLEAERVLDSAKWKAQLRDLDSERIRRALKQAAAIMKSPKLTIDQAANVHTSLVHAIYYDMNDCVPLIRELEGVPYIGAGCLPSQSDPFTKQPPIDQQSGSWHYTVYETRQLTALALRRLKATPRGFAAIGFLPKDETAIVGPAARREAMPKIKPGFTPRAVYETLGPPDYVLFGAWRYDVDDEKPYSVRVIWDTNGVVDKVKMVSPPLWSQDIQDSIGRD